MIDLASYHRILDDLKPFNAQLVAVSKTKPIEDIEELNSHGQTSFGENYVQELLDKSKAIKNLQWHFIGHLQSNKVKSILPIVHLIHGIDSIKLLQEVNKQALKLNLQINCLLQIHISEEETKFGLSYEEATKFLAEDFKTNLSNVNVKGLMGMASNTEDNNLIQSEFRALRKFYDSNLHHGFDTLSMGMTSDYMLALNEGSTMIRIGSAIFGMRNYTTN